MTLRSNWRSQRVLLQTSFSLILVLGAGLIALQPSSADPAAKSTKKSPILLAAEPDDEGRLPPPPPLKKRGAGDEQGAQFRPGPVDDGNATAGPEFNREQMMRRRAIRQRMRQQFGQQRFGNEAPGPDGEMSDSQGPPMRGGVAGTGGNDPSAAGGGFGGGRRRARAFNNEGGLELGNEEGPMPGFAGQGGQGMRRRGAGQRRGFGGDGAGPGFDPDGMPGAMRGPDGPPGAGGPGGEGGFRGRRGAMGGGMPRGGFGGGKALDLTPLGLTEPQKTKIQAMREQTKLKLRDLKKGLSEKQTNMRNLMFSPDASEAQIRSARRDLRTLQDQMDETNLNDLLSIRSLLTPDQKKKLPDCMPGRGRGLAGPGGQGGPGGPVASGGPGAPVGPTVSESFGSESSFATKSTKRSGGMYRKHAAQQSSSTTK